MSGGRFLKWSGCVQRRQTTWQCQRSGRSRSRRRWRISTISPQRCCGRRRRTAASSASDRRTCAGVTPWRPEVPPSPGPPCGISACARASKPCASQSRTPRRLISAGLCKEGAVRLWLWREIWLWPSVAGSFGSGSSQQAAACMALAACSGGDAVVCGPVGICCAGQLYCVVACRSGRGYRSGRGAAVWAAGWRGPSAVSGCRRALSTVHAGLPTGRCDDLRGAARWSKRQVVHLISGRHA